MTRAAAVVVVTFAAATAYADTPTKPAAKPTDECHGECDEIADVESREANLESKAPRKDLTFAASIGGGMMIGGDTGVGRGPALSLRIGHVATRRVVITFELAGSSSLHKPAMSSETLMDQNFGLFTGAQRYTSRSFWIRGAGGMMFLVKNAKTNGTGGDKPFTGAGGLVGAGLDLARWGYLVLGLEVTGIGSVSGDGVKAQGSFGLGLSYY